MNKRQKKKFKKKGCCKKYHISWYWQFQLEDELAFRYLMKNDGKYKIRKAYKYTRVRLTSCSGPESMEYKPSYTLPFNQTEFTAQSKDVEVEFNCYPFELPDSARCQIGRFQHYVDGLPEESTIKKVWDIWLEGIK